MTKISDKAILMNTPIPLVITQGFVFIITVAFPYMIFHIYLLVEKNILFLIGFVFSIVYSVYQIWKMRFYIRNSMESLLKFDPKIEIKPEGIFLSANSKQKDSYKWDDVRETNRTWIANQASYEIELIMDDERRIRIYDTKDWTQFRAIQKWTADKFDNEVQHCRREPITGNLIILNATK